MGTALAVGLIESGVLMAIFFILGLTGWIPSSEDDDCIAANDCYCERLHPGMIKQPINTWSNLGFMLAGLVILIMVGGSGLNPATEPNPMKAPSLLAILYGAVVIFLGPGSMFFHASMKQWGGWLDTFSMVIFTSFLFLYDLIHTLFNAGSAVFLVLWLIANVALGYWTWWMDKNHRGSKILGLTPGSFAFGSFAILWVVLQFIILLGGAGGTGRGWTFFILAVVSFGSAFVVWQLSKTGGPLCKPDSWLQGHGLWHLLGALTAFFIFLYFQSGVR
ncbi:MAG: ceramidase domain-containing protein [Chloroflexi bacterium]|nr:ceramidase domain-containing protein [Chloroflexota bacterium]